MSILRHATLVAMPFLAGAALAQAPAPKAPPSIPGVSPQGSAIAVAKMHANDALLKQLFVQMRDTSMQLQVETQRPVLNVDLFATLVKKLDALQTQFHSKQTDNIILTLRALPVGDRGPFLKAISVKPANAAPPAH